MKEKDLKKKCMAWVKKSKLKNFWMYHPQDFSHSGIPDFLMCANSKFGACELKTVRGRVAPIQAHTMAMIVAAGGAVAVVRSFEEFKNFVMIFYQQQQKGE